jgi:hypothetical protein
MDDFQEKLNERQCKDVLKSLAKEPDPQSLTARNAEVLLLSATTRSWRHGDTQKPHERGKEFGQLLMKATSHGLSLLQQQALVAGTLDLELAETLIELCEALNDWVCPQSYSGNPHSRQQLYRDASGAWCAAAVPSAHHRKGFCAVQPAEVTVGTVQGAITAVHRCSCCVHDI